MSSSSFLGLAWEDALEGDREVEHKERLHVQVGLRAANVCERARSECYEVAVSRCVRLSRLLGEKVARRERRVANSTGGHGRVHVGRNLRDGESVSLLSTPLAKGVPG